MDPTQRSNAASWLTSPENPWRLFCPTSTINNSNNCVQPFNVQTVQPTSASVPQHGSEIINRMAVFGGSNIRYPQPQHTHMDANHSAASAVRRNLMTKSFSVDTFAELYDTGISSAKRSESHNNNTSEFGQKSTLDRRKSASQEDLSNAVEFAFDCSIENCDCAQHPNDCNDIPGFINENQTLGSHSGNTMVHPVHSCISVPCFGCNSQSCPCQGNEWTAFVKNTGPNRANVKCNPTIYTNSAEAPSLCSSSTLFYTMTGNTGGGNPHDEPHPSTYAHLDANGNYEVVTWDDQEDSEYYQFVESHVQTDGCQGEQKTPQQDFSGFDGYFTAPSSPASVTDEYCVVGGASGYAIDKQTGVNAGFNDDASNACLETFSADMVHELEKLTETESDSGSDKVVQSGGKHENNTYGQKTFHTQRQSQANVKRKHRYINRSIPGPLQLETPPYFSADAIQYIGYPSSAENALVVGRGSFGVVYRAQFADPNFRDLPIVVKEFEEEFSNIKDIIVEAQRLFYLHDTGYVPICYGILCYAVDGRQKLCIIQEYVGTGQTLEQLIWEPEDLPMHMWFHIALQCCEGLERFHRKGILLNDIKSNNILLEFGNNLVKIRYIDFGLATDMTGKRYRNTKSLEKFYYLAPEVRKKGQLTDMASDVYSLGFMIDQIRKASGLQGLYTAAHLCMDDDPAMRLPVQGAINLIMKEIMKLGLPPSIR